jgi:hypothetical protein
VDKILNKNREHIFLSGTLIAFDDELIKSVFKIKTISNQPLNIIIIKKSNFPQKGVNIKIGLYYRSKNILLEELKKLRDKELFYRYFAGAQILVIILNYVKKEILELVKEKFGKFINSIDVPIIILEHHPKKGGSKDTEIQNTLKNFRETLITKRERVKIVENDLSSFKKDNYKDLILNMAQELINF